MGIQGYWLFVLDIQYYLTKPGIYFTRERANSIAANLWPRVTGRTIQDYYKTEAKCQNSYKTKGHAPNIINRIDNLDSKIQDAEAKVSAYRLEMLNKLNLLHLLYEIDK